jgi:hypothetical protein
MGAPRVLLASRLRCLFSEPAHVPLVKKYIAQQEEHHRKVTFQDEFRKLCKKYGIELDEKYAWD